MNAPDPPDTRPPRTRTSRSALVRAGQVLGAAMLVATLGALFAHGVAQQSRTNIHPVAGDQSEYFAYAAALARSPSSFVPDRAQMPLYPWILSESLHLSSRSDTQLTSAAFADAKRLGVVIAVAGLLGLAAFTWRRHGGGAALVATMFIAFGLLVYKAPWAQSDVLYYFCFAACLFAMYHALQHPGALQGAVVGLLAGLALMAKPSVLPALAVFLLACGVRIAMGTGRPPHDHRRIDYLVTLLSSALLFVSVVAPYAATSDRYYGSPFYNVNSTYYLWYDSWAQVTRGTLLAGDRRGRPHLPASQIPSMSRYLASHSWSDVVGRFTSGLVVQFRNLWAFGWGGPTVFLAVSVVGCVWLDRRRFRDLASQNRLPLGFGVAMLVGYLLSWSWFARIDAGPRFVQALLVPFVVVGVGIVTRTLSTRTLTVKGRQLLATRAWLVSAVVVIVPFAIRAAFVLSDRVHGGT